MRKTEVVTIPSTSEGRDKGKRFLITEMPAFKAERWAFRALLALAHAGVEMPEDAPSGGMQSIALIGIKALNNLDFNEARPLLDEMMTCVQVMPDPKNPAIVRPLLMAESEGDDIEEIATILMLRERIFRLHTDFFFKGKK
jgi:hypothetical protein